MRREQKLDELARAATQEPKRAVVAASIDELEQQLGAVGGGQRHQGLSERLLEAKESVSQDVEDSDGDGEAPQSSKTVCPIISSIISSIVVNFASLIRTH